MRLTFSSLHVCASVRPQIRCCSKGDDAKGRADMCKGGKVVSVAFSFIMSNSRCSLSMYLIAVTRIIFVMFKLSHPLDT